MKQRILVAITIDPDSEPRASATEKHMGIGLDQGTGKTEPMPMYEINVYRNDVDGQMPETLTRESLVTSLAHELGHVVSSIANTPANANDPRSKPKGNRWTEHPADAVIASEQEAWNIARMIAPDLDESEANRNLATYASPREREQLEMELRLAIVADALRNMRDREVN